MGSLGADHDLAVGGPLRKLLGSVAEIVVHEGTLARDHVRAIERHLGSKWLDTTFPDDTPELCGEACEDACDTEHTCHTEGACASDYFTPGSECAADCQQMVIDCESCALFDHGDCVLVCELDNTCVDGSDEMASYCASLSCTDLEGSCDELCVECNACVSDHFTCTDACEPCADD